VAFFFFLSPLVASSLPVSGFCVSCDHGRRGSGRTVTNTARVRSLGDALVARDWGDARGRRALL